MDRRVLACQSSLQVLIARHRPIRLDTSRLQGSDGGGDVVVEKEKQGLKIMPIIKDP